VNGKESSKKPELKLLPKPRLKDIINAAGGQVNCGFYYAHRIILQTRPHFVGGKAGR